MRLFSNILRQVKFIPKIGAGLIVLYFVSIISFGQTNIVNHEQFDNNPVPIIPSAWTKGSWNLNYNYGSGNEHNLASEPNVARIAGSGVSFNLYFWIPVTFTNGNTYDVNLWRKNALNMKIVFNETADLTTPLSTETKINATGGWSQITFSTYTHNTATTTGYIGICIITDNGVSSYDYVDDITVTETCAAPSTQAANIGYANTNACQMDISWTRGNGNRLLVIAKAGSAPTGPSNGTNYTPNANFMSGQSVGGGYAVYDGTGTSFTMTGLSASSTYYFAIYEYNSSCTAYNLTALTGNNTTVSTPAQSTNFGTSAIGPWQMDVSWTRGGGNYVLVVAHAGAAVNADPTQGSTYTANSVFGSGSQIGTGNYVVYNGTGTSVTITNLIASTNYYFAIYEYLTTCNSYNLTELTGNQATIRSTKYYVNDGSSTGDIYTTSTGNNANAGSGPNIPKLTLAGLLNAGYTFQSGDIIYIDAGTYNSDGGTPTTDEHQLDIGAGYTGVTFLGAGWDKTIFDHNYGGTSTDYFMYIHGNNNLTLKDIQVKKFENNGSQTPGHSGQAFTISGSTNVLFDHVLMQLDGKSGGNPSISVLANSTVTLKEGGSMCNVWHTQYTGGIEAYGNNITLNIQDYVLGYNYKSGSYDGAGLLISNANNTTTVNVTNTRFYNNEASDGGGISQRGGVLNVSDCIIDGNLAGQTSATIYGGGVRISGGTATFTRVKFTNNTIGSGGGTLKGGAIAAYSLDGNVSLTLDNCSFSGNAATGDDIYAQKSFSNTVSISASQTTFSSSSDAIYNEDGTISLTNCSNPTIAGTNTPAVSFVNTNAPSSTPSPSPPDFSGSCGTISSLPVELVSFEGICDDNKIKLNWATVSETNNNYFTIEKSTDGIYWDVLTTFAGAGNSNNYLSYSVTDDEQIATRRYYRLKQTDFDGQYTYSNIITVFSCLENNFDMVVAGNPVIGNMNILVNTAEKQKAYLYLKDMLGRNIFEKEVDLNKGDNSLMYDVRMTGSGIYLLKMEPISSGKPVIKEILINN
jgi:hypothetical protein